MGVRILILAGLVMLAGCGRVAEKHATVATDDPRWMAGYREGYDQGIDEGRTRACNEIRRYKSAMAKDLDENTQICGYEEDNQPEQKPKP